MHTPPRGNPDIAIGPFPPASSSSYATTVLFDLVRGLGTTALYIAARNRVEIESENGLLDPPNRQTVGEGLGGAGPVTPAPRLGPRTKTDRVNGALKEVCVNERGFVDLLVKRAREGGRERGLLTVSNHISILDDPLMWSTLFYSHTFTGLPRSVQKILTRPENCRWSLGSHDICFQSGIASRIFMRGQTLPTHRFAHSPFGGAFQSTMAEAIKLLSYAPHPNQILFPQIATFSTNHNDSFPSPTAPIESAPPLPSSSSVTTNHHPSSRNALGWLHIFPEGRVAQPALEARFPLDPAHAIDEIAVMKGHSLRYFKWGTARLILESEPCPDVVPMWIQGFDAIVPEPHVLLDQIRAEVEPGAGGTPRIREVPMEGEGGGGGGGDEVVASQSPQSSTSPPARPTLIQSLQTRLPHRVAQIADWVNPPPQSHHLQNSRTGGMPRVIFGPAIPVSEWDDVRREWRALVEAPAGASEPSKGGWGLGAIVSFLGGLGAAPSSSSSSAPLDPSARADQLRSRVCEMLRQKVLAVGRHAGAQDVLLADRLGLNGVAAKSAEMGVTDRDAGLVSDGGGASSFWLWRWLWQRVSG